MRDGHVQVNGTPARPSLALSAGDVVDLRLPAPPPSDLVPQPADFTVVYEDAHLAVVEKPAGLVVHPGAGHPDHTLVNGLLHRLGALSPVGLPARPGIVHRIDAGTSGLLVVARTEAAHHGLAAQFAAHSVDRLYHAVVWDRGLPDAGTWRTRYGRHVNDRRRFTGLGVHDKRAVTHWEVLERLPPCAVVAFRLETGRTHQIRVHASEAGFALVGDPVYGERRRIEQPPALRQRGFELGLTRQALHATRLGFEHPITGAWLAFDAAWPDDLAVAVSALRHACGVSSAS